MVGQIFRRGVDAGESRRFSLIALRHLLLATIWMAWMLTGNIPA